MDAGSRSPLQEQFLQRKKSRENLDRFTVKGSLPEAISGDFQHEQDPDSKPAKARRYIPQTSERTLGAPVLQDDYCLNLLDWRSSNVLAIALGDIVYLWDPTVGNTSELVTVDDEVGPVTNVKWEPDGRHIALGLNNFDVQLWDSASNKREPDAVPEIGRPGTDAGVGRGAGVVLAGGVREEREMGYFIQSA